MPLERPLEITVSGLSGISCTVVARGPSWKLRDVKADVERATGVPAKQQRLLDGAIELQGDDEDLAAVESRSKRYGAADLTLLRWSPVQAEWLPRLQRGADVSEAPTEVHGDRQLILAALRARGARDLINGLHGRGGPALARIAAQWCGDAEVILAAARRMRYPYDGSTRIGSLLSGVTEQLRSDRDFALAVIGLDGSGEALSYLSQVMQTDRNFVLSAVRLRGTQLSAAAYHFRQDHEVVLAAVTQDSNALQFAAGHLQMDVEILAAAVLSRLRYEHALSIEYEEARPWCGLHWLQPDLCERIWADPGLVSKLADRVPVDLLWGRAHGFAPVDLLFSPEIRSRFPSNVYVRLLCHRHGVWHWSALPRDVRRRLGFESCVEQTEGSPADMLPAAACAALQLQPPEWKTCTAEARERRAGRDARRREHRTAREARARLARRYGVTQARGGRRKPGEKVELEP